MDILECLVIANKSRGSHGLGVARVAVVLCGLKDKDINSFSIILEKFKIYIKGDIAGDIKGYNDYKFDDFGDINKYLDLDKIDFKMYLQ